jgi:hypothetical protein
MITHSRTAALLLGICLLLGLTMLGYQLGSAAIRFKEYDRTVTVKGLSEQEVGADIVIWPIQFTLAGNDLEALYTAVEKSNLMIRGFLEQHGIAAADISASAPMVTDKSAQQWADNARAEFRYSAMQTVTVYSGDIVSVRGVMAQLSELGKQGIVFSGNYQQTEYLYSGLNEIKPAMIEEATRNAREVAEKFAADSQSGLGKIRSASQGQFTISDRDQNNPHIKKVRVVSTIEYYLSD